MARKSKAHAGAVYRGQGVKQFTHDLSNYSEIRRGLSPSMRAQTMTKTELNNVDARIVDKYISELNRWRGMSQAQKAERAGSGGSYPVEKLFNEVIKSGYVSGNDKAILNAASLKLKTLTKEQSKVELMEALNARDRTRSSDFYKAVGYLEDDAFDAEQATDDMLREIVVSGYINDPKYAALVDGIIDEYVKRLGPGGDAQLASERSSYINDIIKIAQMIVG